MNMSFIDLERKRLLKERERLNGDSLNKPAEADDHDDKKMSCDMLGKQDNLSKNTKNWFNYSGYGISEMREPRDDDMEQWVSDTFYSYFPGFNNENQKRQLYLQKRQRENQENFLKHQMLNGGQCSKTHIETCTSSGRSNNSSITSIDTVNFNEGAKADVEIIDVKNPNYNSSNTVNTVRPGSTRYKLLQDLRHTNLSNVASGNQEGIMNLNRNHVGIDSARKKEYQRELMQQIEEKRRSIKILKEKEHEQEKVLTRRLQEQLKTIKLEEKLEKERIKATKVRFNAEQNRFMRKHILEKLENDSKLLPLDRSTSLIDDKTNKENVSNRNENKVYKYFSNSEKAEYNYRKKLFMPTDIGLAVDQLDFPKIERECFHLSEKICPLCDLPLKELEDFCLRCQSRIALPVKMPSTDNVEKAYLKSKTFWGHNKDTEETKSNIDGSEGSYYLVCFKCERFYTLCSSCLDKSDVCRACQCKRNVCMNCRRTLCTFCLEEVACGKNTENVHINESEGLINTCNEETPFQVIINGEAEGIVDDNKSSSREILPAETKKLSMNVSEENPPYSINIKRDSIFHPDKKLNSLYTTDKVNNTQILKDHQKCQRLENIKDDSKQNIERLRRQTDIRLMRYLKNYGELAFQSRGTQTTPNTNARRDIVINGENSLSMPILHEMPKMTRNESTNSKKHLSNDLENLKRRWDIPAVQKFTVSPTSPKIVTQVGAIRKQLQADSLFFDDGD